MPDEPTTETPAPVVPAADAVAEAPIVEAPQYASKSDFERLERMLTTAVSALARPPAHEPVAQTPEQVSDDQLYTLATQGNKAALDEYVGRIAQKHAGVIQSGSQKQQAVMGQLAVLYRKYPELGDAQNPLTQKALAFQRALLQMGEQNTRETELNAILRAVADSRELLSKPVGQPRQNNVSQFPATPRQQAAPADVAGGEPVTPQEYRLASQFGVKDPKKAKQKFWERNGKGTSSVSPNIAAALAMQQPGDR